MLQLKRMLPAEGWLTQRLADLRRKAYRMREGHVARSREIAALTEKLPPVAKRKLSEELQARYHELGFDVRLCVARSVPTPGLDIARPDPCTAKRYLCEFRTRDPSSRSPRELFGRRTTSRRDGQGR